MKKIGRNEPCRCGSEKKYKLCCYHLDSSYLKKLGLLDLTVFAHYNQLKDPRGKQGQYFKLIDLLIMVIYGLLCDKKDFTNIADYLKVNGHYFKQLLNIDKVPSHDCLSDLFAVIDAKEFMELFIEWMQSIIIDTNNKIISIDGKAIRSAHDNGEPVPYILSAFLSELKLSIGQLKVDNKTNEQGAMPELLELIDIKGATITADAMLTTIDIGEKIVKEGGIFVLKVKGNQPTLEEELLFYFDEEIKSENEEIEIFETEIEKNHGRIEKRTYYLSYNTNMISNDKWNNVKAVGKVKVYREHRGKITEEDHYFIISKEIRMEHFIKSTRSHWGIECSLHWVLDVILKEDASRNRVKNSIDNLSIVRKMVFNLARLDKSFGENVPLARKITRYQYGFEHIESLLFKANFSLD